MPMNYPATELYNLAGERRVVWSDEEYQSALTEGWSEERPTEPTAALIQEDQPVKLPAKRRK